MNAKTRRFVSIGIAFLILFGMMLGIYVADSRAKKNASERAQAVLIDSAREQSRTFAFALQERFHMLHMIASLLDKSEDADPASIEETLLAVTNGTNRIFAGVDFLYTDGSKATGDDQFDVNVSDRAHFIKAISGEDAMERIVGRVTNRDCVVLAVPCRQGGEICGVLRGVLYEEDLRTLLSSQAYGGSSFSFLVASNGDIIVNTEDESMFIDESNILDTLSNASFPRGGSADGLLNQLRSKQSAAMHYNLNGRARVAVLMPLQSDTLPPNDWYIVNVVSEEELLSEIGASRSDSIIAMLIFAAFSLTALGLFLLLERDYRLTIRKDAEGMRQREEQFRIVTEQSGKFVMRYHIPTRTASRSDVAADGFGGEERVIDPVRVNIEAGVIDPISEADYRAFYDRVNAGESPVSADILMLRSDGMRRWYRHDATAVFNDRGEPEIAIISYYDDTEQRERALAYAKWQQELESISYERAALYEWNLTQDIKEGQRGSLTADYTHLEKDTFDARTAYFVERFVYEEDRAAFAALMNREHLIALYFGGVFRSSVDYRFVDEDGSVRWRNISVQLVPYPDSRDIKAYVTNRDIDEEKREELKLVERSQQDFLTGALNRETFILRVNEVIERMPNATHALLMVDIDGFKQVNDMLGHDAGDRVLSDFADSMRAILRTGDVVGRIGGDEFMIFLPDMPFDSAIGRKAAQLCSALRRKLNEYLVLSVSIGVSIYPRNGTRFDELYRCADAALYYAKGSGKDSYIFYRTDMAGDTVVSQIVSPAPSPVVRRRAVLVATDSDELYNAIHDMLAHTYDACRVRDEASVSEQLNGDSLICAAILDTDTDVGRSLLKDCGALMSAHGVTLFAVSHERSDEAYVRLLKSGVTLSFNKPVNRELLLQRLQLLYAQRDTEKSPPQDAIDRIQNAEETHAGDERRDQ